MAHFNPEQLWMQLVQEALAHADKQMPHDSQDRKKRALEYCAQKLGRGSLPLLPSMNYLFGEMIENPRLITADIRTLREHVVKKGHCFNHPDLPKCSVRSMELRRAGNQLYVQKKFENALEKYNESICCAPNDSEDLGIGYANRSAIYYEKGEYELTLANIALARRYNYPDQLLPKLLVRESNCNEKLIERSMLKRATKHPTLSFVLERNPRIPSLSKGISVRKLPIYGNGLVAEQAFKPGDVILHEKPLMICVALPNKYISCSYCLSGNLLHLIPCPKCTSAMFCNEECLQKGFKVHRFECGVTAKLVRINDMQLGPRMFFHGLTLFEDNVDKLMAFYMANEKTDKTFFDLDYTNYDPLEEFKVFIGAKIERDAFHIAMTKIYIQMCAVIYYTIFMEMPLVRSLITTEAQKEFMVKYFIHNTYRTIRMEIFMDSIADKSGQFYPVASLVNHSCDPNTLSLDYGGQMKFVVLRPIRRGEQILVSYGSHYSQPPAFRSCRLGACPFTCSCDVCNIQESPSWWDRYQRPNPFSPADWTTFSRIVLGIEVDVTDADKMNALRQFVQRYASFHPQADLCNVLMMYSTHLETCHKLEMETEMRKKIVG